MNRAPAATRLVLVLVVVALVGCAEDSGPLPDTTTGAVATNSTGAPATSAPVATSTAPTTTTVDDGVPRGSVDFLGEEEFGRTIDGRALTAWHRGTPDGVVLLVVGVIHGDEDAGLAIVEGLATAAVPPGVDLWVVPSINPDGTARQQRGNANGVDLNRNFPHDWTPIAEPGDWQYSGSGPASEPETQAFIGFAERLRPALTLWYHQDLFCLTPSKGRDRPLREAYASISGLPIVTVTGGTYTGVAATWTRTVLDEAMSFIVELGPTLPDDEAERHVEAVMTVGAMTRDLERPATSSP